MFESRRAHAEVVEILRGGRDRAVRTRQQQERTLDFVIAVLYRFRSGLHAFDRQSLHIFADGGKGNVSDRVFVRRNQRDHARRRIRLLAFRYEGIFIRFVLADVLERNAVLCDDLFKRFSRTAAGFSHDHENVLFPAAARRRGARNGKHRRYQKYQYFFHFFLLLFFVLSV